MTCRTRLLASICVGLLTLCTACGGSDGSGGATQTSTAIKHAGADVLVRRDEPPGGVPREIRYFQEGSPPPCEGFLAHTLSLGIGHGSIQEYQANKVYEGSRPTDGDQVYVCVDPTLQQAKVELRVEYPDGGTFRGTIRPSQDSQLEVPVAAGALGRYDVETTDPPGAEVSFTLEPAKKPAYRVVGERGQAPKVLVVGLQPGELVNLHVYEPNPNPTSAAQLRAGYRATQRNQADSRGRLFVHLDPRAAVSGHCYLIKTEVKGRLLYDGNTTLGGYCAP